MIDEEKLFSKSRDRWGLEAQILMLAEEAAELSVAALHLKRDADKEGLGTIGKSWENLAEEIADVEFLIAEMRFYFPWLDFKIRSQRGKKRDRLEAILKDKEGRGGRLK